MTIKNRIFDVRIAISGRDIMRCLNLLARRNVAVYDMKWKENTILYCNVSSQLLWNNRDVFHKTHCKVKIIKKNVWNLKLQKHLFRGVAVAWALMLLIGLFYSYQFVWKIDMEGNQYYSKEYMIKELKKMGIEEGTLKRNIHEKEVAAKLRNSIPGIRWTSIGIQGTKLLLRMEEATDENESNIKNSEEEWNWEELSQLKQNPRKEYFFEKEYIISEQRLRAQETQKETVIQIGGYMLSLDFPWNKEKEKNHQNLMKEYNAEQLSLGSQFYLPVYVWKNVSNFLEEEYNTRSKSEVVCLANYDFTHFLMDLEENGVHIIDKNVIMEQDENSYIAKGRVIGEPDLALRLKEGYRK